MRKRTKTSIKKSLDKLWSQAIRERDLLCCKCKKPTTEAHHIFGRRNLMTRWDLENGLGLCSSCHIFAKDSFEQSPYDLGNMNVVADKIGNTGLVRLRERSSAIAKFTVEDLLLLETYFKSL